MKFVTYRKFFERAEATTLGDILSNNNVEYCITDERASLDSTYGDKTFDLQYFVKIQAKDFSKVDLILQELSKNEIRNVAADHYLFSFTDEELFEILIKPDEWNEFDCELAKKILKDRGKEVDAHTVQLMRSHRIKELAKPHEGSRTFIYAGYIFSLLGGFLGIIIGWHLATAKKTLPNGQQVYGFAKEDRKHGTRMFIIGTVFFFTYVILRLLNLELF
jgi:hypothetical protein